MDTTLELTPKHYAVKVTKNFGNYTLKDLRVTRILFFANDADPTSGLQDSPSKLSVQLDLQQRNRRLEYHSGVYGFDLKQLLSDQKLGIATRMGGGSRAKPRVVTITFGPQLMVWLDEMLQKGFIVPDGK